MTIRKSILFGMAVLATAYWSCDAAFAQRGGHNGGGGGGGHDGGHASAPGVSGHSSGPNGNAHSDGSVSAHSDGNISINSHGDGDDGRESHESFYRGPSDRSDNDRDDRIENRNRNDFGGVLNNGNRSNGNSRLSNNRNRNDYWTSYSNRVRNDFSGRDRRNLPFASGWFDNYRNDRWYGSGPYASSGWNGHPYYWWGGTPVGRLTSWFAFGWDRPRYWGYGSDANIYCDDGYVYYDGERYEPVSDYYQQIFDLAHSAPKIDEKQAKDMEWAPLGVFAIAPDSGRGDKGTPERTLQIAVNKEGVIGGTFYNADNKQVHPISGMVDEHTQRAAWAFSDDERPKLVFETSINNLTRDQSTMMVHHGPNEKDTAVWHLVRLQQPDDSQQTNSGDENRNDSSNDLP